MKKIFTLATFIVLTNVTFAQKVDYDNDSKWFFGLNVGGTWNTTDVKSKTHAGLGFIFGRQFNYNYGRFASYDLRLRYLGGKWYGQDYDTTSLNGYTPQYMPTEYAAYQTAPGYTVNNFESEVHELGLELAIHANRMRERSGWDPYIFGGLNLAWNRNYSDLIDGDSSFFLFGQYDYSGEINKASINALLDGNYETAMNQGSEGAGRNVDFVPSLGFGIGYQVGPRFSLGVEHKTSFALKDDWDGYVDPEKRWGMFENDVYHYTSGYLRFHIRGGNVDTDIDQNNGNNNLVQNNCDEPVVDLPSGNGVLETDQQIYVFRARVTFIGGAENIVVRVNGTQTTNFFYNVNTQELEASLVLNEGTNAVEVTATNGCGSDIENMTVNYVTCKNPTIVFTSPANNNSNVENAQYVVRANVQGATSVSLKLNETATNNFYFNASNGSFESNLTLRQGANSVQITAVNACGTVTETITINYTNCVEPTVQLLVANGSTVANPAFTLKANILNVVNNNGISVRLNGVNKTFVYNAGTKVLESALSLNVGLNTIVITASNDCATDTETFTVTYTPCLEPQITMVQPTTETSTSATTTLPFSASVLNVAGANELVLKVNGVVVAGGTYSLATKLFQATITLVQGTNSIQLIATNNCATDVLNLTVGYNAPCFEPSVAILAPIVNNSTTETQLLNVSASVLNVTGANQIQLKLNGATISGGTYAANTHIYSNNVTLQQGVNTIVITGTNDCGSESATIVINYNPCLAPNITMVTPISESVQSETANYMMKAAIQNIQNGTQVQVTVNGVIQAGGTFANATGQFTQTLNLNNGVNVVVITVTTNCGTVSDSFTVSYNPCQTPVVTRITPAGATHTTTDATLLVQAKVLNVSNVNQIVLNVNGAVVLGGTYNAATQIFQHTINLQNGLNNVVVTATTNCGTSSQTWTITKNEIVVEMITICHYPPGNTGNPQQIQIPLAAWPAHQAHGDVLGPCPVVEEEETITICHYPPGNTGNPQQIQIPLAAWPAHQAHGDVLGPCPVVEEEAEEEMITICHYPPGNTGNPQQIQIPLAAWPAHQAHGDVLGPCPVVEEEVEEEMITICHYPPGNTGNPQQLQIPLAAWPAHQAHGDVLGPCPVVEEEVEEEMITICHYPPGNTGNPQQIQIPLAAWPAHQAHGDVLGPCPVEEDDQEEIQNQNGLGGIGTQEMITICHHPPGNPENTQTLRIPLEAWPAHQAHGDVIGPCPVEEAPGNNGNNGHGNNEDGVDGSNPGQGGGGPNGQNDESGDEDDENNNGNRNSEQEELKKAAEKAEKEKVEQEELKKAADKANAEKAAKAKAEQEEKEKKGGIIDEKKKPEGENPKVGGGGDAIEKKK